MRRPFSAMLCILLLLSLVACADSSAPVDDETVSASEETPSAPAITGAPPVAAPEVPDGNGPLPEIEGVHTDYSAYTPYAHTNDEIYTRLSADFLPELVPSDGYGTLVPYIGEFLCEMDYDPFVIYGLCTTDGMVVTDSVYKDVYQVSVHSDYLGPIKLPAYRLERLMAENEIRYQAEPDEDRSGQDDGQAPAWSKGAASIAVCALDGSWVTDYYHRANFYEEFMLLHREKDADVFDYNGNLLYNTRDLNVDILLDDDPSFEWSNHIDNYGDGFFLLRKWSSAGQGEDEDEGEGRRMYDLIAFVNVLTGEAHVLDYYYIGAFQEGRAAVSMGGLWGYIDTDMELSIDLQFKHAERFIGGLARCTLPGGKDVLITRDGEVTAESDSYLRNPAEKSYRDWVTEPEFIYESEGGTDVRDRNGKILFTYHGSLRYLEQAGVFALSRYHVYGSWQSVLTTFELLDTDGKCVFRKSVASQWRDD